ncbi:MAG: ankyrin repeat domain-containing protein [Proteobacteria bacterium]|nr:ankyrin repeat domain-containing protein [Pseudomonadota bacterium]
MRRSPDSSIAGLGANTQNTRRKDARGKLDVTGKSNHRVGAALALVAALVLVPAPARAGHNPDLIPKAPGAEFRVLNLRLFDAAEKGETEMVVQFLAEGASVEGRDKFGNTALLLAARAGRTQAVEVLLEAGSEVDHRNLRGSSALSWEFLVGSPRDAGRAGIAAHWSQPRARR